MSFHGKDFNQRFAAMGDEAEGVFEQVYPNNWTRTGLDRPPIRLSDVPAKIRNTPDYLTAKGWVECQGFGNDGILKVKLAKLEACGHHHIDFRLDFFWWHSPSKEYGYSRWTEIAALVDKHEVEIKEFHDGPEYAAIPKAMIPTTTGWTEYNAEAT